MSKYVAGLMFSADRQNIALIRKVKPPAQKDKLNAIGGKIEAGELPIQAMVREFEEETGVLTAHSDWQPLVLLHNDNFQVFFYVAFDDIVFRVKTTTEEPVHLHRVNRIIKPCTYPYPPMKSLLWLIPLALYPGRDCSNFVHVKEKL